MESIAFVPLLVLLVLVCLEEFKRHVKTQGAQIVDQPSTMCALEGLCRLSRNGNLVVLGLRCMHVPEGLQKSTFTF